MRRTEDSKADTLGFIALSWHASYRKQEIPRRIWDSNSTSLVLRMVGSTGLGWGGVPKEMLIPALQNEKLAF